MKPHKHASLIKQWADGVEIQYRSPGAEKWYDVGSDNPAWDAGTEYRVKPVMKKYRVGLCKANNVVVVTTEGEAAYVEPRTHFIRWLTDWVEYEA